MAMICVEHVSLCIKKKDILRDINLELERGKIHGLIGRNGSGKTMLMKCICGFVRPSAGVIRVDGKRIGTDVDFPESIGVIIETPEFIPYLSGYENLRILAGCRKIADAARLRSVMEEVGLDPESRLPVKKYSMGMRQRLGLAQAIMEEPALLVLDEPFNGLDEDGVAQMRAMLAAKREAGATIVISSHNPADIDALCDTVHRIYKGEIRP